MLEGLQRVLMRIQEIQQRFMPQSIYTPAPPQSFRKTFAQKANALSEAQAHEKSMQPKDAPFPYWDHVTEAARRYQLDPYLIFSVMKAESNFNPYAVSSKGAQGLMQLMPETAKSLGVQNPFSERQNIDGGARYLKAMLSRFADLKLALAAYNAGPGAVERFRGIPPYSETQAFVERVLRLYNAYRRP